MPDEEKGVPGDGTTDEIGRQAERRMRARQRRSRSIWFGLGMFGLVGWAVAVPTLIGIVLGLWLDRVAPQTFSWPLTLLLAGVVLGAINAWLWVERESRGE